MAEEKNPALSIVEDLLVFWRFQPDPLQSGGTLENLGISLKLATHLALAVYYHLVTTIGASF